MLTRFNCFQVLNLSFFSVLSTDHMQSTVFRHDKTVGTEKQPGCTPVPNDVSRSVLFSPHTITPSLCLLIETPTKMQTPSSSSPGSCLHLSWHPARGLAHQHRREEPAPAESHSSWTWGGWEWLRAERMSQMSCAELALSGVSALNGFC